jgi:glutamyl-tRNA reductase
MVDLAVPRDIDPAVAELEDVYLFSIDDLQQLIDENRQQREVAAGGARLVIDEEVARFLAESRARTRDPPSARCVSRPTASVANRGAGAAHAGRGQIPDEVIEYLANTLTNRLLHAPPRPCARPPSWPIGTWRRP